MFFCLDESPTAVILCAVSGYMMQHISSQCVQTIWNMNGWDGNYYNATILLLNILVRLLILPLVYTLLYILFARKAAQVTLSDSQNRNLLHLSITTLLVVLLLSGVRDSFANESITLMLVSRMFSVFCCVFLLYLRTAILEKGAMEQEQQEQRRLHTMQLEQYQQKRETIELISIKCHDLKHRVE